MIKIGMTLTLVQLLSKIASRSVWRTARTVTALFCIFVFTSASTHAGPVRISEVIQTVNTFQSSLDLKLRNAAQDPGATSGHSENTSGLNRGSKTDSLLSGATATTQTSQIVVDVEDGVVEGTVCDCGDILVAGGGFPKWPLLFLAAIPLIFINDCETCDSVTTTPTPIPPNSVTPPASVPEPASLFLFGSGLLAFGAGLRRRYSKTQLGPHTKHAEEE